MNRSACGGCMGCLGWVLFLAAVSLLVIALLAPSEVKADGIVSIDPPPEKQTKVANVCFGIYAEAREAGHPTYVAMMLYGDGYIGWSRSRMYDMCWDQYPSWDWPVDDDKHFRYPLPTWNDIRLQSVCISRYQPMPQEQDISRCGYRLPSVFVSTGKPCADC
jgi:hypothetical protein